MRLAASLEGLSFFTEYNVPLWAKNPQRRDSSREAEFIDCLDIDKWGYDRLIEAFCPDEEEYQKLEDWIKPKSDQWLMSLYALLFYASDHFHGSADNDLKIIRTTDYGRTRRFDGA